MSRGKLYVLAGPSGSGKGTVLRRLFERLDRLYFSVSVTTRAPRPGEVNGRDYHYISPEEMKRLIEGGMLLEYAEYVGNYYGTPLGPIEEQLSAGNDIILEIEVQGALSVRSRFPEAVMIFMIPPSFAELEERLRNRCTEAEEKIRSRISVAREEYTHIGVFDYVIINDTIEDATDMLRCIIKTHRAQLENHVPITD